MRGELATLNFDWWIGSDGAEIVADFLKHDETVRKVYVNSCNIGPREIKAIAESLKHNQTLWYLDLLGNPIRDEGAEALIEALAHNVCMKVLNMIANRTAPKLRATIEFLTQTRNELLIPDAARRASLSLIAARRNIADAGVLAIFPKEIVKMIAMQVWAMRKDPIWIETVSNAENLTRQEEFVGQWKII